MKLLHTGDLHLDSPFCSLGSETAEKRREGQRAILKNIFLTARNESCDMVLISGDLFDAGFVTPETAELFCRLVRDYGLPVVVAPGNHDAYTASSFYARENLPENLYVFSSKELTSFKFSKLGAEVFGYAFCSPALNESPLSSAELPEDNGYLRLLCAHGDFGVPISRYAPITVSDVDRFGFAYAALGHIHKRSHAVTPGGTPVVYCGFAEGRSFDEEGEGGAVLVNIENDKASYEWRKLSEKLYVSLELDVSDISERSELVQKIKEITTNERYAKGAHMRLSLVGAIDSAELYDIESLEDETRAGLEFLEIRNETIPVPSAEYLQKDTTIRGELYRVLLPMLNSEDREERKRASRALAIGLSAIDGNSVSGRRG